MAIAPAAEPAATTRPVTKLRPRIVRLPVRSGRRGLLGRRPLRPRLCRLGLLLAAESAQAALQVVEDEAGSRLRPGRRGDHAVAVRDEEDYAVSERDVELDQRFPLRLVLLGRP